MDRLPLYVKSVLFDWQAVVCLAVAVQMAKLPGKSPLAGKATLQWHRKKVLLLTRYALI